MDLVSGDIPGPMPSRMNRAEQAIAHTSGVIVRRFICEYQPGLRELRVLLPHRRMEATPVRVLL
jgi:hypothetical protein